MTGVEAVSNGVSAFREPAVNYARRTLTAIIVLLAVMLAGIAYLCWAYGIGAIERGRAGYQSILSQLTAAVVGRGWFYYVTIGSVLTVLEQDQRNRRHDINIRIAVQPETKQAIRRSLLPETLRRVNDKKFKLLRHFFRFPAGLPVTGLV